MISVIEFGSLNGVSREGSGSTGGDTWEGIGTVDGISCEGMGAGYGVGWAESATNSSADQYQGNC